MGNDFGDALAGNASLYRSEVGRGDLREVGRGYPTRTKTNEQIGREYKHLKRIYHERDSRQGSNQYQEKNASVKGLTEAPPSDLAAEKLGVSKPTANKAERVVDAIDTLEEAGDTPSAEHLLDKLKGEAHRGATR